MTAVLHSDYVWEGTSAEMDSVEARDGHVYKQLDTGDSYIRRSGVWQFVSAGLSCVKATKSGRIVTDSNGIYDVVFETPIADILYTVELTCEEDDSPNVAGFSMLTTSGFRITTRKIQNRHIQGNVVVSWLATRDYNP